MTCKVSIIVPVYNVEQYLQKCLDSILSQTLSDIEVICVDDGSTDNSLKILYDYQRKDNRIHVVSQENAGPGAARNKGIELSQGEYIGFVDADDFIEKDMYRKMVSRAEKYNADIVIANSYLYFDKTMDKQIFRDMTLFTKFENEEYFTAKQHPQILTIVGMWDRLFRKSFVNQISFSNPVGRFYEDHFPSFQSSVLANRISVIKEPLYYYRQQREGSTVNREAKFDSYKFDFLKDYQEVRDFLISTGEYSSYQDQFLRYKIPLAVMHQQNMTSRMSFKKYFKEFKVLFHKDDYEFLKTENFWGWSFLKQYCNALMRNSWLRAYILFCKKRYIKDDFLFYYLEIPKTGVNLKMKKNHFFQRQQTDLVLQQLRRNAEIENAILHFLHTVYDDNGAI